MPGCENNASTSLGVGSRIVVFERNVQVPANIRKRCGPQIPQIPREFHGAKEGEIGQFETVHRATGLQNGTIERSVMGSEKADVLQQGSERRPQFAERLLSGHIFPGNAVNIGEPEFAPGRAYQAANPFHDTVFPHDDQRHRARAVARVARRFKIDGHKIR